MPTTLIISNDFPPRIGGIESFVAELCRLLDDRVVVLTSGNGPAGRRADRLHDAGLAFPVVRTGRLLLPTRRVARLATRLMAEYDASRVIFGAAAPLSLLAPTLRRAGAERILALSHGHETWWAQVPVARTLLRRMADGVDAFGVISDFTAARIAPALSQAGRARLVRIPPPVDGERFYPRARDRSSEDHAGDEYGQATRPRCVAAGRFVPQKGFETLLTAWRQVLDSPVGARDPELVLIGDGPRRDRLTSLVRDLALSDSVRFTGALSHGQLAVELRAGQVFALPVRTRWAGLNPEGLGLGFCEAAACGLPVVVGRSGGAPETVRDGVSGFVVEPDDPTPWAARLIELLGDQTLAARMGAAGRAHALDRFSSDLVARQVRHALRLDAES